MLKFKVRKCTLRFHLTSLQLALCLVHLLLRLKILPRLSLAFLLPFSILQKLANSHCLLASLPRPFPCQSQSPATSQFADAESVGTAVFADACSYKLGVAKQPMFDPQPFQFHGLVAENRPRGHARSCRGLVSAWDPHTSMVCPRIPTRGRL